VASFCRHTEDKRRTTGPLPVQQATELHRSRRTRLSCRSFWEASVWKFFTPPRPTMAAVPASAAVAALQRRARKGSPARGGRHRGWASRKVPASNPTTLPTVGGCCLTPWSTGRATASHLGPVGGTLYIFANRAKAPCLRPPVTSNVRRHRKPSPPTLRHVHTHRLLLLRPTSR